MECGGLGLDTFLMAGNALKGQRALPFCTARNWRKMDKPCSGSQGSAAGVGREVEVEERLCYWLKGIKYHITSHLYLQNTLCVCSTPGS